MKSTSKSMRIVHRYLGFFLAGIMAVYATSGTVLIFRDTDFLKQEKKIEKQIEAHLDGEEIGRQLGIRGFRIDQEAGVVISFENGTYDKSTGEAIYTVKALPGILEKMTNLHKARSAQPLFFLNIFFAVSLLFFVVSSFWMFMPGTSVFKKGLYFTLGGIVITLMLLLI
jgi:hypothetical protein